jgi:hypothetical protein
MLDLILLIIFFLILAWVLWLWLGKRIVRTSRAAILVTAIPQALLAIAFVVLYLLTLGSANRWALSDIWTICFYVSCGIAAASFLSSVVFAIMREWEIAKGTGFGSGIGLVVVMPAFFFGLVLFMG